MALSKIIVIFWATVKYTTILQTVVTMGIAKNHSGWGNPILGRPGLPDFVTKLPDFVTKLPDFVTGLPDFVTGLPDFVTKLPDFVTKLPDFVTKLPDFVTGLPDFVTGYRISLPGNQFRPCTKPGGLQN